MNRTSSLALLVFAIGVAVLGVIMRFAVEVTTTGFDSHQAGIIMLVVGIALALVALILLVVVSKNRSTPEDRR
jgi:uncharacterized membrane protein YidH (DUF202 family)